MKLTGTRPADSEARRQALDPARSFIVQAPAGSGKTELLIQRILALLAVVNEPEEILAITFTRKAAGEMQERLLRALANAAQPEPAAEHEQTTWRLARAALENDHRRQWRLLDNPSRLTVQTIDSFCAALVRRMPWLSRFGAQAMVTEDAGELYRQAAERVVALAEGQGPGSAEAHLLLEHLDNRLERLRDLLVAMLGRRDQWLRHLAGIRDDEQRPRLEGALRSLAEELLQQGAQIFGRDWSDRLVELGAYAGANLVDSGSSSAITALAGICAFPEPTAEYLQQWRGLCDLLLTANGSLRRRLDRNCGFPPGKTPPNAERKKDMQELLEALAGQPAVLDVLQAIRDLPPIVYDDAQWQILQALVGLLPRAVAELWLVFKERGQCDFIEVAQAAGRALGEAGCPTDLLLHLDSRIRHILVDEFQDTSWGQFVLLERLTDGWQADDGRSLFLVGDPMQSIYRFREAEVGLYLRARRHGIGQVSLTPLTLQANFRSQAGIVDWVNRSFPDIFPPREEEALGGVCYAPSEASRSALDDAAVCWHPFADKEDLAEAERVVALVAEARDEHPTGTVAVLVRARTHLRSILRALRRAGVRYRAQEIDPLTDRPVVQDLLALTRALLHSGDRVAQLAVLRAPWCGLSLADLQVLCNEAPGSTVGELLRDSRRRQLLSLQGRQRVMRVQEVLNKARSQRGILTLRQLVEGAWLALGGPACVDEAALEDASVALDLLEGLDCGGDLLPFEGFADKLARLFAAPDPAADDSLQVMTIHKAKGLEFDTVIVPGLGRRPRVSDKPLLRWLELPASSLLLAPIAPLDGQSEDPIYDAIGRMERIKDDFELARLLYVAATRAKRRLHLLGQAISSADGEWRPAPGSLLAKMWPVAEAAFASLAVDSLKGEQAVSACPQSIRRLPLDWRLPAFPLPADDSAAAVVKPSHLGGHEGELRLALETEEGRHIGTVTHHMLERIALDGVAAWPAERLEAEQAALAARLRQLGIGASRAENAVAKVLQALRQAVRGERGQWLLGGHDQAECELSLSGMVDGQLVHAVIDRTFIDDQGVRWIVDYKTSAPAEKDAESFMSAEGARYKGQMDIYQRLFEELDPGRRIRTALYFPSIDGWYEFMEPSSA